MQFANGLIAFDLALQTTFVLDIFLKMKLFKVLLGSACAGPVGPGALMTVGLEETWWPVKTCVQDKACFNWRIGAKPGWEGSDAKNLRCETNENSWFFGQCVCKDNSMDANNDPWDGCELSYDESVCYFGSCEDHSSSEGETCGGYTNLNCMSGGCCECFQGALTVDGLGCINLVPTVCPFDEIVNNGVCVPDCRDGWSYDRGDEVCEPVCRDGEYFDEAVYDRGCVPTCEEGQELSFKFEKPECMTSCKPNQAHEPHVTGEHSRRRKRHTMPGPADTRVCVTKCPEDYFYCPESGEESGYCALTAQCENRLCPDLFKYNPISAKCEFQCELDEENVFPNFEVEYDSSFGYCIPKCPPKEEYNPEFNADGCTPICDRNDNFLSINEETGEAYCEWCEDEHVYDPIAEECVYDCPEGTDYYEYIPACLPHCEKNNETSIYYNIELERCTEKCSFGKVLRSEEIDGNFIDKCYDECTLMTEWNPETKMCIDMCTIPYEWNADKLKCEIACPNGLYKDEEGNDTPSEFSEGQGACIPICDDGFMFDRYVDPYHCIEECNWRNETFDEEIMGCRERCKKNFDYNYESSMCELECKEGWEATMVPGTNDDNDDEGRMTMDEMRCSPICKIYEKLNKIKNECENICPEWLNYNSESGNCTLTCPDNYYFSPPDECVPQCKKDDSCTPEICRTKVDVEAVCDVSSEKISFEDAEKACSAKGGSLWVPKSNADLDYIIDLGKELWLGIEFNGDDWVYSKDGSKIKNTLTAWKYGDAPIPSKDGYGCVKHEKKGTWKDDDCGHDHNYMCAVEGVNCFNVDADGMVEVNCDGTRPTEPECQTETEADAVCEKSKHAKKHSDAKKACNEKGGHLWSPKHDHDHDYLSQMVEDADIWVGIEHDGDNWVFTDDGSIVEDFSNWKDGSKPSYKEGKHCAKKEKKSGNYKEYDCEKEKHYVCKFDRYDCINDLPVVTDDGTIQNDCPDGCEQPVTVEDPCAVNDDMTPADAAAFCAAGNGKLWAPRTQADLDYINGLGDVETWLGIKWNGIKWAYTDSNEEVSATMHNWKDGASPADAYGKECVKREKKGTWKEDDCSHEHSFICQYDGVDCLSRIDGPADTCNGEVVEPLDCPDGSLYSPELADCVPDCGENFEFSIKHLKCITRCPEGEIFGANVDKCREQCVEGDFYDKDLDACVTDCPKGTDYSDSQQCDDVDECTVDENVKVSADGICIPGYSSASFDLADRFCKGKGGSLLTPTTQADFDYIQSLGDEEFWLGIVTNEDGDLVYVETGEAINDVLTNWAESRKSSKDHDHSCVKREKKGTWKLDDCLHTHNYICKVEEIDCDNLPDVVDGYFVVNQVRPSDICGKDNECTNTDGGYDCACSDGFAWSDKREWCVPEWCSVLDEAGIENNWSIKQQNCTARCQGGMEFII